MARCPICKSQAPRRDENPWAPFCCQRCKLIDLGNWIGGSYRIPDDDEAIPDDHRLNRDQRLDRPTTPPRRGRR